MRLSTGERDAIRRRIQIAVKHADDTYRKDVKTACDLYEGRHYEDLKVRRNYDRIVVNVLKGVVETKVAGIAFTDPDFFIQPVSVRGEENLTRTRDVLKWEWRRQKLMNTMRAALRDRETLGLGIARARWRFVATTGNGPMPRGTEQIAGGRPAILGEEDPSLGAGDVAYEEPVLRARIRHDHPTVERIRPAAFFVNPEAPADLKEALYCGHTVVRTLAEVKRDKRLKNTGKLQGSVEPLRDLLPPDLYHAKRPQDTPEDVRRIALHIYYEMERELCAIFTDEQAEALWVGPWDSPSGEYPYRVTRCESGDDGFFPKPPLLELLHPQREINHARSAIARHIRQANGKYQTNATLTPRNRSEIRSDKELGIVEIEGNGRLDVVPPIPIPADLWNAEALAKGDIGILAALSEYQLFQTPTKRTNTSEVNAIQGAGQPRAQMARADFENFVGELGADVLALLQTYATYTRNLPVFNRAGRIAGVEEYRKEEIEGEYLVQVYVGSTRAPERERIAEQLGFIFQSMPNLLQALQMGDALGINLRPFVRYMLMTAAPDVRDVETLIPDDAPVSAIQTGLNGLLAAGQEGPAALPAGVPPDALAGGPPAGDALDLGSLIESMSPAEQIALLGTIEPGLGLPA